METILKDVRVVERTVLSNKCSYDEVINRLICEDVLHLDNKLVL